MNPNDQNESLFEKQAVQAEKIETEKNYTLDPGYSYHVFLSHNSKDKSEILRLKQELESKGIICWYDGDNLPLGSPYLSKMEHGLRNSQSVIVAIGPNGLGQWQEEEINAAMVLHKATDGRAIIPILLPGATSDSMPVFLATRTLGDMQYGNPSYLEMLAQSILDNKNELTRKNKAKDLFNSDSGSSKPTAPRKNKQPSPIKPAIDANDGEISIEMFLGSINVDLIKEISSTTEGLNKITKLIKTVKKPDEKIHLTVTILISASIRPELEVYDLCENAFKQIKEFDGTIIEKALSSDKLNEDKHILNFLDLLRRLGVTIGLVAQTGFGSMYPMVRKQIAIWLEGVATDDPLRNCWLLDALEKEEDKEVKIFIKRSLVAARMINVTEIGKYLESMSIEVIEQSLVMLTRASRPLSGPTSQKIILIALSNENYNLRDTARVLSGRIILEECHRQAIGKQFETASDIRHIWAMELLLALPRDELARFEDRIVSNLQSNHPRARMLALHCVRKFGPESYYDQIATLAIDQNAEVARYALYLLACVGKKSASICKFLVEHFDDIQPKDLLVRLFGFFSIADPAVIRVLRRSIQADYETEVRIGALITLSKIDPDLEWMYNTLISFAIQTESALHPRIHLCFAELSRRDDRVFDKLFKELVNENLRLPILLFLQAAPDIAHRATPLLPSLLESYDVRIKKASLELLEIIGFCDDDIQAKCHQMLRSDEKEIVISCLKALAVVGDQKSMFEIQSLFFNSKGGLKRKKEWRWKTWVFRERNPKKMLFEDMDVQSEALSALYRLRKKYKNRNYP